MHKAFINNKSFDIDTDGANLIVNGQPLSWDLVQYGAGYIHILYKNKSFRVEVVKAEASTKTFTLKINTNLYIVSVKDKFDLLLDQMGMSSPVSGKVNSINAPMPGLIIDMKVKEGDSVEPSNVLLILEAMKMENIIKSPVGGLIKSIKVKIGDSVEKGQVLIEF